MKSCEKLMEPDRKLDLDFKNARVKIGKYFHCKKVLNNEMSQNICKAD